MSKPHHKLPLNDAQLAVLAWVAEGCPDGVWEGYSHRSSAVALRNRGLIKTTGRAKAWKATITAAGAERLATDGVLVETPAPAPEAPSAEGTTDAKKPAPKYVSVSTALVIAVEEAGGVLKLSGDSYNEIETYRRRARAANAHGKVPEGKRLVVDGSWREFEVRLEDAIPGTDVESSPVPVPGRLTRPHPVTARFRDQKEHHEVSRAQMARCLRIVQAIVVEAERRGFTVKNVEDRPGERRRGAWTPDPDGHLLLSRGDDSFHLRIREEGIGSRVKWNEAKHWYDSRHEWPYGNHGPAPGPYDTGATGRLVISVDGYAGQGRRGQWADRQRWTLEQKLPETLPGTGGADGRSCPRADPGR